MSQALRILTVTLNPALDLVGRVNRIEIGEVNTVETLGLYPAGKGINVAKVLADLGINLSVSGFLGKDNQGDFVQLFEQNKLNDHFQRIEGKTRINVKITEIENDVTDLNFLGFNVSEQNWQNFVQYSQQWHTQYDLVAVCGSLPQGIRAEQFADWLKSLKNQGLKVVLDSSNAALTAGLKASPWLVKPNHRELETWVGRQLNSINEIIDAAKELQAQNIENVIISMGAEGSIWLNHDNVIQAQPPRCQDIVSTVGAGDSMVAGLIYGFSQGLNQEQTLAFASATSALAVSQSNVGVKDRTKLDSILQQVKITQL
ncbi:1-phosphofructokinase [Pasteurella atlantica]|uniref:1-phosphofructokinase n=1 Tax=Pasteurellaceae TaxID=712 RepID=UPI0027481DA6|nr:1-phosphofructokinase [Pasteurella atlantica]MDP8033535.1 1-phosphofructokinase [Pasteurella atlantica]MDP8035470.1 1-phosphofructokinase [Pasteurella atlantica]MDP8037421.1 1-phosphofructokinase [Pasteurella atlantica]MDP8047770.1 1-phosphofructokinase [Pasteurella atlantica]MDP8049669.1 1-phosphofructokinase [Pasteurella atlantica]